MQGGGNPATVRPSGTFAVAAAVTPTSVPRRRLPLYAFPSLRIVPTSQETTVRRLQPRKQKHSELGRPPQVAQPGRQAEGRPRLGSGTQPLGLAGAQRGPRRGRARPQPRAALAPDAFPGVEGACP